MQTFRNATDVHIYSINSYDPLCKPCNTPLDNPLHIAPSKEPRLQLIVEFQKLGKPREPNTPQLRNIP